MMVNPNEPRDAVFAQIFKKRGDVSALAKRLDLTPGAIYKWRHIPAEVEVLKTVSEFSGLPPRKLRPDLAALFCECDKKNKE